MPPPVIIRNGGSGGGGGGGAMIAVVVMMFCILLSGIVGAALYIFWEDLFPPGPGAPGAPGTTTPSPYYYGSPTDSSSPPGAPGSSPGGAPGSPPIAPGSLEMLKDSRVDFTLKRLSDEKTLDENYWKLIMYKDGRDYRWNYHHKGDDGGFIYNNNEGGNQAMFNKNPKDPRNSEIHVSKRYGSEDKPYWFFKLWTKKSWTYTGSEDRALQGYRITPHNDVDGVTNCLDFDSDDGPAVWRPCVREDAEDPEAFKKQIYFLRVGGGK
jgi:hypothetical protein